MPMEWKSLDCFLLNGSLTRNYVCTYSPDNRIAVVAEAGVYVVHLKPDLASVSPFFGCKKFFLKPSNYAISDKVNIDINELIYSLPKDQLYVSVLRSELSASLKSADPVEASVTSAQWSPKGFVTKTESALAILTSLHSLEIYIKKLDHNGVIKYNLVTNLTEQILNERKHFWKDTKNLGLQNIYAEFIKRVESIVPTAFCWGHHFKHEHVFYIVIFVGHFDGSISVWRLSEVTYDGQDEECTFLGRYSTKLGHICCLYWHRTSEFGGGLCVGDQSGKIAIIQVKDLNQFRCSLDNEVEFWSQKDAPVDKILVTTIGNLFTILIGVKQSSLLIFALDFVGKVFDFVIHNVKNFYITGIECYKDILFIQTFDGPFKQLKIEVDMLNLKITESIMPLKIDLTKYRSHGFVLSPNKIFMVALYFPKYTKQLIKVAGKIYFEVFHNAASKPFEILMGVEDRSLGEFWDCFEVLRLICLKEKRFPWLGLQPNTNYDKLPLEKLKILRLVAKISETVYNSVSRVLSYNIKPYILIHYLVTIKLTVKRIETLLQTSKTGTELTTFQMQSIFIQNFYLKQMVVGGILAKANVGQKFIDDISTVMEICNELEYPEMPQCWSCGERILGITCVPPHADSRCCFSMMPLFMVPVVQCPLCSSMAHPEIFEEMNPILCPYCDIPMEHISTNPNMDQVLNENEYILKNGEVQSACFEDCLIDGLDIEDLEENETEYVVFSDSEDDTVDQGTLNSENNYIQTKQSNNLERLYTKVANMTVGEVKNFVKELDQSITESEI